MGNTIDFLIGAVLGGFIAACLTADHYSSPEDLGKEVVIYEDENVEIYEYSNER